jgi:hypothetical protein
VVVDEAVAEVEAEVQAALEFDGQESA